MSHLNAAHMKQFVERNKGLVRALHVNENMIVLKYHNKVFYKNLWTPEMCELRGTIVDRDFNIIQRPFTKIFNYGERKTRIARDDMVIAPRKVNGFMAAATIHDGKLLVSTTGSVTSDFADLARTWLEPKKYAFLDKYTYIFEICDPTDPHVIPEEYGAWLLGVRAKKWDTPNHLFDESELDQFAENYGFFRPEWERIRFSGLVKKSKTVNHEGFVCWNDRGDELKIKSPFYLATKFLGRKTDAKLDQILSDPESVRKIIDEEFYGVLEHLATVKDDFIAKTEHERFAYLRDYFENEVL